MRRTLTKIGKVLLVAIAVLVVLHTALTLILGWRLEAKLRALKAAGQPTTLAELGGPEVPDSENAALIYERIFKELGSPQYERDAQTIPYSSPTWDFEHSPDWSAARQAVERYENVIHLAEQAAALPKCRFAVNWQAGLAAAFPHFAKLREFARFASSYAVVQSHYGNTDKATRALELGLDANRRVAGDPTLISHLVNIAGIGIVGRGIEDSLRYGTGFSEAQCRRLYDALVKIDLTAAFRRAVAGERAFFISSLQEIDPRRGYLTRPWSYAEQLAQIKYSERLLKTADLSYRELSAQGLIGKGQFPWYFPLMRIVTPVYSRVIAQRDKGIAEIRGSQILLALEAYKDRYGSYPEDLTELRSKLGWKVAEDPFSGKDFVYHRHGDGFLFYSFGMDLRDDGGRDFGKSKGQKGDIVWTVGR